MSGNILSVALPVKNGENYLAAALDSILAQTHTDFVLHVSDNASDDGTAGILADYASRDPRVLVSRSEIPLSQVDNTNRAVALAQTPWVKLFCHDDLMRSDCLATLVDAIKQLDGTKVALIGNGERHLYSTGYLTEAGPDGPLEIIDGHQALRQRFSRAASAGRGVPSITTATVRKDAFFAQSGFDGRYVYFEIFRWYLMQVDYDYAYLPAALTINRIHGQQVASVARASLRQSADYRLFVSEFLGQHGDAVGLDRRSRWFAQLIAPGRAATEIACELRAGRPKRALQMLMQVRSAWLPLVCAASLRAWFAEGRRTAPLRGKVPDALLYP